MATKKVKLKGPDLSPEQIAMVEAGRKRPVVYDEDLPRFTKEELSQFQRVSELRRENRVKQVVSLRLSQPTIRKAKSLGKGYTGFLSRLIELAMDDPELVKRAL